MQKIRISFLCNFIAIFVATFELKGSRASSSRGFLARVPRAGSSRGFFGRVHGVRRAVRSDVENSNLLFMLFYRDFCSYF